MKRLSIEEIKRAILSGLFIMHKTLLFDKGF
jgi:hypothetical protein